MGDVNPTAEAAISDSSAEFSESVNDINQDQGFDSSAETLNADNQQGPIPYDRFQEKVNQYNEASTKLKDYEQRIQTYQEQEQDYAYYKQLDQLIAQNPRVAEGFKQFIAMVNQQAQGNGQGQQLDPAMQQVMQAAQTALQTTQQMVLDQYQNDFANFLEAEGIDEELAPYCQHLAQQELLKLNQNPLGGYDKVSAKKALENVKGFIERIYTKKQTQYTKQKQEDQTPPSASKGGVPPFKKPDYSTAEARVARVLEGL